MNARPNITISGKGETYSLSVNGRPVLGRRFTNNCNAVTAAQRLEERLIREAGQAERPCINCGQTFQSAHRHNRLCPDCSGLG